MKLTYKQKLNLTLSLTIIIYTLLNIFLKAQAYNQLGVISINGQFYPCKEEEGYVVLIDKNGNFRYEENEDFICSYVINARIYFTTLSNNGKDRVLNLAGVQDTGL